MIFKFVTTKPSVVDIWNTLSKTEFKPVNGRSSDTLKFSAFILLQLPIDFKHHRDLINTHLSTPSDAIYNAARTIIEKDFRIDNATYTTYPLFVDKALYVPYYMFKSLKFASSHSLWLELFDRTLMSDKESSNITIDLDTSSTSLTLYSLHNKVVNVMEYIEFNQDRVRTPIKSKDEMVNYIQARLEDTIKSVPDGILPNSVKTHIPYFKLEGTSDAS